MKSLMSLWRVTAEELAVRCRTSTTADFKTVCSRVENEGLSFLTITLPSFCDDFQKSLSVGMVDRSLFTGFQWKGGLPRFLGGFLDLVFDRSSGLLLDRPDVEAIYSIRQLTLMFGKIGLPCSDERVDRAISGYIKCEKEVRIHDAERSETDNLDFTRMSRMLWADVFASVDRKVYEAHLIPRHGPGATADHLVGNRKFEQREWTERLEDVFPSWDYIIPNPRYISYLDHVDFLEPGAERPVRVITVPKTLKTPRIIAIEPTAMQYMQQALSRDLVGSIQRSDSRHGWCLGFTDQEPNQLLAREGSRTGALATLDLSEASDRVSNQLVRSMLAPHPWLAKGVDACRSRKADVPSHGVIRLAKFASMGSALTFPVEAMVFATIVFLGIERVLKTQMTHGMINSFRGKVRIYGDDIIVPTDYVQSVVELLETFGFRVNLGKSFWTGKFRESCGKEYYDGEDVSVTRVRSLLPTQRTDAPEVISTVSLRNRCYLGGLWATARYLDELLVPVLRHYPTVMPDASVLGRWSLVGYETQRVHPYLHIPLVKGWAVRATIPENKLDDVGALMKVLLSRAEEEDLDDHGSSHGTSGVFDPFLNSLKNGVPAVDERHLERSGRPQVVDITLGWFSPLSSSPLF